MEKGPEEPTEEVRTLPADTDNLPPAKKFLLIWSEIISFMKK